MPIARAHERLIVARLMLDLVKGVSRHFYPDLPLSEGRDLMLIGNAVAIGHLGGKPLTLSALSRMTEIPPATLKRKLVPLIERGWVLQKGRHFCLNEAKLNDGAHTARLEASIRLIVNAAKLLSKME